MFLAEDYKKAVMTVVTNPEDREKINRAMEEIEKILRKYRK